MVGAMVGAFVDGGGGTLQLPESRSHGSILTRKGRRRQEQSREESCALNPHLGGDRAGYKYD